MTQTAAVVPPIVDLGYVERLATALAAGDTAEIDLGDLVHDRATHADLVPASVLAWWLLSTTLPAESWKIRLPPPGAASLRHLGRSGVLTAGLIRGMDMRHPDGAVFALAHLHSDPSRHAPRLPGIDWEVFDELQSADRLRILPDLTDLRRTVPDAEEGKLAYPWLANLGLASPAISPVGYQRLLADADAVLGELIDNVHRWSESSAAFAAVSVTRGGALDCDRRESWNRLHIVIADSGIGIPVALRKDLDALAAVHEAAEDVTPLDALDDGGIVERLLKHAFGKRKLPNHNGHGLNAAQIRATQWIGAFDVVTIDRAGDPLRRGSRGLDPAVLESDDHTVTLPGARGTVVHLMLQATDASRVRRQAADAEQLPFDAASFDAGLERLFADVAL